jgi:hypothetical protein
MTATTRMLRVVLPPWLLLALPYFFFVDRHMPHPRDGYWHMGKLMAFSGRQWTGALLVSTC